MLRGISQIRGFLRTNHPPGHRAGVASVPNVLGRAATYPELVSLADSQTLGHDLVVQTPYGDSGKTTFFIAGAEDWQRHREALIGEDLKVMRRINCAAAAMEAVITRHGTIVGPVMHDLCGHPELTPTAAAGAATTCSQPRCRPSTAALPARPPPGSATAWPKRATAASSRSTTSSTVTAASSTSASSTPASAA